MDQVRIGVIGVGGMGTNHATYLQNGTVPGGQLTAVADINPAKLERAKQKFGEQVKRYSSAEELIDSGTVDAVVIATPHYDHPPIGIRAMQSGVHVLAEKPSGVYTRQVRELNQAADDSGLIFGVMFNQRTLPAHRKLKDLLDGGELGPLKRNSWIITGWYRSQSYYDSGGWRATWAGEGGGVLLNQCPHQLDLWQWFCGMPRRVRAFCQFGRYHEIEVEDDVTAYVEYEDGSTGTFITSTGEAPGTNQLEISGDQGKLVLSGRDITFWRNRVGERQFNREFTGGFGAPETWRCEIPVGSGPPRQQHGEVTLAWVNAILANDSSKLIADGREGIRGLEISNAMLMSAWLDDWVDLPIDEDRYYELLKTRIDGSSYSPDAGQDKVMDVGGTY